MKREEKLSEMQERTKAMQTAPGGITSGPQVAEYMQLAAGINQLSALPDGCDVSYNPNTSQWEQVKPQAAASLQLVETQPVPPPQSIQGPSDSDVSRALRNLADLLDSRHR